MVAEKKIKKYFLIFLTFLAIILAFGIHYTVDPWGFYWKVSPEEEALRLSVIKQAESWLGCNESDGSHKPILDIYNAQDPLPVGYTVQITDSWCATFVSTVAIQEEITEILPPECSCGRQIELFQAIECWEERDDIIPLPGDLIYYDWDTKKQGSCLGWPDHVGLVVGTKWPFVKVIEGNKDDSVSYRVILLNNKTIRGFGKPDYKSLIS